MSNMIHRKNSEIRKHLMFNKSSAQILRPKILYAGELKRTVNWNEQPHEHEFCEILYVRSGNGTVHFQGSNLEINAGDILVYNPHVVHYESGNDLSFYFFGVHKIKLENLPENYLLEKSASPVIHTGNTAPVLEFYFSQLVSEAERKLYYYDDISDSLVKAILSHILRILVYGDKNYFKTNESYMQAKKFIDENYADIRSIDDICSSLYISRFYLTHLFKEYSGVSPLKYIIQKRIDFSKELLRTTELPIGEIALRAGYVEINSFIKTFKNVVNMTPHAYRQQEKVNDK